MAEDRRPGGPRRWPTLTVGLLRTAVGAGLLLGSVSSPAALTVLVAVGLILTGLAELIRAERTRAERTRAERTRAERTRADLIRAELTRAGTARHRWMPAAAGAGCLVAGITLAAWPGVTVRAVAVVAGICLILQGVARRGVAGVVLGVLALAWPHITVFVVALIVGGYLVLDGVRSVAASRWSPAGRRPRALAAAVALAVAIPLFAGGLWLHASQPRPDAFYTPPAGVPAVPGALLRSEPFRGGAPPGARAWRMLYTTTRDDRTPTVASAVVLAANRIPPGPRPVLAWAHGATGIARPCAPSLLPDPLGGGAMPGLDQILGSGWVVVATDYPGLGTRGPHPFLIGQGEARAVLDAVRAARHLTAVTVGDRTVVWGHSQGGNAALWTGILAPTYAPDAGVVGVAALAPGSSLPALAKLWGGGHAGVVFAAYLIQAYSETYPDVRFDTYVRPTARIPVHELAGRCLSAPAVYQKGVSALLAGRSVWATDPASGAAGTRLRENVPAGPIPMPVLIAQGDADTMVTPDSQAEYVRRRCAGGGGVDYRTYPGRDHVGLIAADSPLIPDLVRWSRDRLDGGPARSTCPA